MLIVWAKNVALTLKIAKYFRMTLKLSYCELDLEDGDPFYAHDTPAYIYNDVSPYRV